MAKVPTHIAIIMDGNGRWAKKRGLSRTFGHKQGLKRAEEVVKNAKELGVKILTLFAFSTENWRRPKKEVEMLFSYLDDFLSKNKHKFNEERIRINFIGRRDRLKHSLVKSIEEVEELTRDNTDFVLNLAVDYGGRWDILNAVRNLIKDILGGQKKHEEINEDTFKKYLSLFEFPGPDLLIRTSGEIRISNFLLWDIAYTELYFTPCLWPDFTKEELKKAIDEYNRRERRFGRVKP